MHWSVMIWIALYFMIGWIFVEMCDREDEASNMLIFIAWPFIIGGFLLTIVSLALGAIAYCILQFLIYIFIELFCKEN